MSHFSTAQENSARKYILGTNVFEIKWIIRDIKSIPDPSDWTIWSPNGLDRVSHNGLDLIGP